MKGLFKVDEIVTTELGPPEICLKGKKKSVSGEQELVRCFFVRSMECKSEIVSLTESVVYGEAEFARNVFKLARNAVKEIRIFREGGKGTKKGFPTSDLKFLDNSSMSRVLAWYGLNYFLASKGIEDEGNIYCHENLHKCPENLYKNNGKPVDSKLQWMREFRDKAMVKFRKIEDIKFEDKKSDVNVNEDEYVKLGFVRILMQLVVPDTVIYERGSRQYGFPFPINKVTFEKALRDHRINSARIRFDDPYNPGWQADSMTIINHVIKRANIKVDSIYIDGTLRRYVSKNFLRYNPKSAKIILKKDEERVVTTAPWEKAISLSFLNSKEIMIRERTKPYVT